MLEGGRETPQEYRRLLQPWDRDRPQLGGETLMKHVEYWDFVAILGKQEASVKLRTILRRVASYLEPLVE